MSTLSAEQIRQLEPREFIDRCERYVRQFEKRLSEEEARALMEDYASQTPQEIAKLQDSLVERLVDNGFKGAFSDPKMCRDWIGLYFVAEGHGAVYQILQSYV